VISETDAAVNRSVASPNTTATAAAVAPARRGQRSAVVAGALGWTFDAFDFFVLAFVINDVAATFGRSRPEIALTITLALMMRPVGAVLFGIMADRYGRRLPLMINVIFYATISVLSGLAPTYATFLVLRLLFGIGMGGEWGVGTSLALESSGARQRGLLSGLLQEGYAAGYLLAAIAYKTIYPAFGWRAMFVLGGLPALLSLFIRLRVPESQAWQEHRTDWDSYRRSIIPHWRRFLYVVALMTMMNFIAHGTQDLFPVFLQNERHYTVQETANLTIVSMVGAIIGGLTFGSASDRIGRRRAMIIALAGGVLVVPLWILTAHPVLIVAGAFLMQFFVQGAWGVIPAHINELSPNHLRGFFPGFAYQLGVLCASSITFFEAVLGEHFSYGQAMALLAVAVLSGGLAVTAVGPENKGAAFHRTP
jgi:SHS family lactate transporter-like MFS transporter